MKEDRDLWIGVSIHVGERRHYEDHCRPSDFSCPACSANAAVLDIDGHCLRLV